LVASRRSLAGKTAGYAVECVGQSLRWVDTDTLVTFEIMLLLSNVVALKRKLNAELPLAMHKHCLRVAVV
jgi:hypothetical protein